MKNFIRSLVRSRNALPTYDIASIHSSIYGRVKMGLFGLEDIPSRAYADDDLRQSIRLELSSIINAILIYAPVRLVIDDFLLGDEFEMQVTDKPMFRADYLDYSDFLNDQLGNMLWMFWPVGAWYQPVWAARSLMIKKYDGVDIEAALQFKNTRVDALIYKAIVDICKIAMRNLRGRALYDIESRKCFQFLYQLSCYKTDPVQNDAKRETPSYLAPALAHFDESKARIMGQFRISEETWGVLENYYFANGTAYDFTKNYSPNTLDYSGILVDAGFSRSEARRIVREGSRQSKEIYFKMISEASAEAQAQLNRVDMTSHTFKSGHGSYAIS